MFYVVDNGQMDHFASLFSVLRQMGYEWSENLHHIRFGRIHGMSSRRGKSIFLSDVLAEAYERMAEQQKNSPNTRSFDQRVTETLAITSLFVHDMKHSRKADYDFQWEKVLNTNGEQQGSKLQYAHCRLCSLMRSNYHGVREQDLIHIIEEKDIAWETLLSEPAALTLTTRIGLFDEAIRDAFVDLEPKHIVNHLFRLCKNVSLALKKLPVKTAESERLALPRIILFAAAKYRLAEGMQLLGLQPLEEM